MTLLIALRSIVQPGSVLYIQYTLVLIINWKCAVPASWDVFSTVEACRPGISSSEDVGSRSEDASETKKFTAIES